MRKTDYAFWTFLLMTGLAGATTVLNVTQTYSATPASQNSELYRQLDLFGDVLERVCTCISRKFFGLMYDECGSSDDSMPLMAFSMSCVSSGFST